MYIYTTPDRFWSRNEPTEGFYKRVNLPFSGDSWEDIKQMMSNLGFREI